MTSRKKKSTPKKAKIPKKTTPKKSTPKKTAPPKSGIYAKLAFGNTDFLDTMKLKEGTDYTKLGFDNWNRQILVFNNLTPEQHDQLINEYGGTTPMAVCQ